MDIPLPNTVIPGGGVLASMAAGNAFSQQQLQNQMLNLQNQYYPQTTQADINYKNALTSAIPSQIQLARAQAGLTGSETGINQWKLAAKYPLLSDTLQVLAYANGGKVPGDNQNGNAINIPGTNATASPPIANYLNSSDAQQQMKATGQVTIPQNVNSLSSMPNMPDSSNPNNVNSLIMQRLNPLGYAQQQANIPINNELIRESADSGNTATLGYNALREMDAARPELQNAEKGPVFGHNYAFSDSSQRFDQGAAKLDTLMARAAQSGHITDYDLKLFDKMGGSRVQNDEAYKQFSDYNKLLFQRMAEKGQFFAAAQQVGIPPQLAQPLYTKYLTERPVYDFDNKMPIEGNENSWKDYLTPQAIQSMLNGQSYDPRKTALVKIETPDGKEWSIRSDKVNEALSRYPNSKVVK